VRWRLRLDAQRWDLIPEQRIAVAWGWIAIVREFYARFLFLEEGFPIEHHDSHRQRRRRFEGVDGFPFRLRSLQGVVF